jgi:DNA primase
VDVVPLHQAGFDNAVASMGTALTTEQTRLISRYAKEIVICYDNDPAGKKATERALDLLKNSEFNVRVLRLPDRIVDGQAVKIDADDFIRLRGAEAFEKLLTGSGGGMEYRLGELREKYDLTDDVQRLEYLRQVCTLLAEIASPVEREVWCAKAAAGTGVTADALKQETERQRSRNLRNGKKQYERNNSRPARSAQPQEKKLRYENVRSAVAEEGVIRLLLLDPSLIPACPLSAEEFTSSFLGSVYTDLRKRQQEGRSITAAAITAGMEEGESALLTELLNKPEGSGQAKGALNDYVSAIRRERILQSGDLEEITKLMRKKQDPNEP